MRLLLIILFFLFQVAVLAATDVEQKGKELAIIKARIKQITEKMTALRRQKSSLIADLAEIEKQYGEVNLTIRRLNKQALEKKRKLKEIQLKISQQKKNIEQQNLAFQGQVRAAYVMGRSERLKLVMNQQNSAVVSRMLIYYDYYNKARLVMLQDISAKVQVLQSFEQDKQLQSAHLEKILADKKIERGNLLSIKQQRKNSLRSLNKEFDSKALQLSRFEESKKKLQTLIAALQRTLDDFPFDAGPAKPFAQLRGQVAWPIKGRLQKKFGSKRAASNWDGVLIGAEEGKEVHAVARGRIVFAEWLRGYGLLSIIDHGKGYMTLYAFNQSLHKEVGDWVEGGDVIATVGKSGGRGQAGLYFGIRKKGKAVDPQKWCRKVRKGWVG